MRYLAHLAVLLIVALSTIELPEPAVLAAQPTPLPTPRFVQPPITEPRASLSTRLPQPMPVDPRATPLPSPRPTPIPIDPSATPLPGPTSAPAAQPAAQPARAVGGWPVAGTITTGFSAAHPAVDIAAPCGTPVVAPASGTVVYAGWKANGGGLVVDIETAIGLVSLNHLLSLGAGGYVEQGQIVGYVGMSGWATGCHVHWSLYRDGWVNPLS